MSKFGKGLCVLVIMIMSLMFVLIGCGESASTTSTTNAEVTAPEPPKPTYMAELYDNHGNMWLNIEGNHFDIEPNKVKQYGYSSDGDWDYWYETSSIVSISIDDYDIESCGSTALFYDTRLKKIDLELPKEIDTTDESNESSIEAPNDLEFEDYWGLHWWWDTTNTKGNVGKRLVVIQSQEGDPICMFEGNEVSWEIPKNLPKTTEINIDGKLLYVHRSNFSIIDTDIFEEVVNE